MFEPVTRYLPRYFKRDPAARMAIRLTAPAAAVWEIVEDRLTITWGQQLREYDLLDHTVGSLVDALQLEGFVLEQYDQDLLALGAIILLEGRRDLSAAGGTDIFGFTNLIHSLTRPVERAWGEIRDAIPEAAAQVSLAEADGDWLDRHGLLYGIPRLTGQDDTAYHQHLLDEITRPRNDARGMELTLRRWSGHDIQVREPWQEIFTLSASRLSGRHHLQGAPTYQYHTLQLVADTGGVAWDSWLAIANADRPAGSVMLAPQTILPPWVVTGDTATMEIRLSREDEVTLTSYWATSLWDGAWDDRSWVDSTRLIQIGPAYNDLDLQEFATTDGDLFQTADGVYFGVIE